jgi:hypothetical protein
MTSLNKVGQLSRRERRLLIHSVLLLPIIHVALLVLGYSRLRGVMEKLLPLKPIEMHPCEAENIQRARDIARIVSIAARHGLYKATCLRRSLLAWWFLRGQGIQSRICFGVRKMDRQLEAHAWVEYQGIVINDSERVREAYQTLEETFPPTKLGL